MQPAKSIGRFLPTLFLIGYGFYLFTDPQGAAVALKWAFESIGAGAQQFAEFIKAIRQ